MSGPDAPREEDSERNGLLSYAAEWHAFSNGVYFGVATKPRASPPSIDNLTVKAQRDVRKEPHYFRGGYVIGQLLQIGLVAAVIVLTHSAFGGVIS